MQIESYQVPIHIGTQNYLAAQKLLDERIYKLMHALMSHLGKLTGLAAVIVKQGFVVGARFLPARVFAVLARYTLQIPHAFSPAGHAYWSQITEQLWVGGMPLANYKHARCLQDIGIQALVSMNQNDEFCAGPWTLPVHFEDWEHSDVNYYRFPSQDMHAPDGSSVHEAVEAIRHEIGLGHRVYLHCNVGRGRSVTVAACFLRTLGYEADEAIQLLYRQRPQASLTEAQIQCVRDYRPSIN